MTRVLPQQTDTVTSRTAALRVAVIYLVFAVLWIYASDRLLGLLVQDKDWLAWIGTIKGLGYVAVTTLLLYLLLRSWNRGKTEPETARATPQRNRLIAVFLVLALSVPVLVFSAVRVQRAHIQKEARADLDAIAQLKTNQIEQWLGERRTDAMVLMASEGFTDELERWFLIRDREAKAQVDRRLEAMISAFNYKVELLDALSHPDDPVRDAQLRAALATQQVQMSELYRDNGGEVWLDFVVPLFKHTSAGQRPVGAVVLRAPAGHFLFPLIQAWPTASPTAETLIFRREGKSILFLNELRHRRNTALTFRLPLDTPGLPAAVATRNGGVPQALEGRDYRGVPVLAAVRPVHGTSWLLVAKVDESELMSPLHRLVTWVSAVCLVAIAALASVVMLFWRQQQRAQRLELVAQTGAALRDSEQRLAGLVNSAMDAIIAIDESQRIVLFNPAAEQMFGLGADMALGRPFEQLLPQPSRERHAQYIRAFGRTSITSRNMRALGALSGLRANGEEFPIEASISQIEVQDGKLYTFILRDITERKRAEQALHYQLLLTQSIADKATDSIFVNDAEGRVTFANPEAERVFGYSADELMGKQLHNIVHHRTPDGRPYPMSECPLCRVYRTGEVTRDLEAVFYRKDGNPVHVTASNAALDSEGKRVGAALVLHDITERKAAELALREREEDLNRAQAVGHIGSWRFDLRRNGLKWSAENHRIFGIAEGMPLAYETFLATVHPADRSYVDHVWKAGLKGEHFEFEHRIVVDGNVRWVREKAELEFDERGNLLGAFGTAQDISERKLAEQALLEANRRKNEFLSLLAHELRNPMAVTTTAVYLLQTKGLTDPETRRWAAATIASQTEHLKRLVDDLLDIARIGRGKIALQKTQFDLVQLIAKLEQARRALTHGRKQHFVVSLPSLPLWVEADSARVTQIVTNLLDNAFKFTQTNGRIELSLRREGDQAVICVRDTGRGITPELLPRIFDIFTQGEVSLARDEGGLGLGLALVKNLVELHGGNVNAASEGSGKGAEFTVRLPALPAPPPAISPTNMLESDGSVKRRILIAEDNALAAQAMAQVLQHAGHSVRLAHDGTAALAAAEAELPEIAVFDVGLPTIDGYALARRIRGLPEGERVLLIALTGYGQAKDHDRSRLAGFNYHMVKPADIEKLLGIISNWKPPLQA